MATHTTVQSGAWSAAGTWDAQGVPVDNGVVVIAAGHSIEYDEDMSNAGTWPNGIAGLTITSHATTPAMLFPKYSADGTYHLKIKTGTTIAGTNAAAKGRLLANSNGTWGATGALPFGRKFIIDLVTTARIVGLYLDIALYCTEPTNKYATVYGTKLAVNTVTTATDILTLSGAHGWAANTPVMVRSSGNMPGGLLSNYVYYVTSPSGADLKLAAYSGGAAIDITSAGSGTIEVYSGHTDTGTGTVNVLENLTGDAGWTTTDGHDAVVLVDAAAPADYDQQRLSLVAIAAGTLQLSANVDSAQYPGARVFLMSRNVSIRSSCVTAVNIIDYTSATHGGVFGCEIRSTAGAGVGVTTFYGTGLNYGSGHTVSGTVSGCSNGLIYGTGHTVSGTVSGCSNGLIYGTGHTVSGTVSGCNIGLIYGSGHTVSGTVSGCSYGLNYGTGHTVSGTVSGCSYGLNYGTGHTVSGTVSGCSYGLIYGSGHTVSGTVSGCSNGLYFGSAAFRGATFTGNTRDLYNCITEGAATLASGTQNGAYKYTTLPMVECAFAAMVSPLAGVAGSHACWTQGGYSKSAAYAVGTHGTPPVASALIHEMAFEDSNRIGYVELPYWGKAGVPLTATMYGKLTGTAAFLTLPSIGIYDPSKPWQGASERLNTVEGLVVAPSPTRQLTSVKCALRKTGSPTGNVYVKLYARTGDYSTSTDLPTGSALATSDAVDVSTISAATPDGSNPDTYTTFTFSTPYTLGLGGYYITLEYAGGGASDYIRWYSEQVRTHGNGAYRIGAAAWTTEEQNRAMLLYDGATELWSNIVCTTYAPIAATLAATERGSSFNLGTDWQTLTATYTPTYDRELRIRVQGIGGNAGGTGTEKLYWFSDVSGAAAGGGGPVIGSRIVKGV